MSEKEHRIRSRIRGPTSHYVTNKPDCMESLDSSIHQVPPEELPDGSKWSKAMKLPNNWGKNHPLTSYALGYHSGTRV